MTTMVKTFIVKDTHWERANAITLLHVIMKLPTARCALHRRLAD